MKVGEFGQREMNEEVTGRKNEKTKKRPEIYSGR